MLFNSYAFLFFFPAVTLLYFVFPAKARNYLLLVASYVFYMGWNPRYALLLLACTAITYGASLLLGRARHPGVLVGVSVAAILGALFYFKYLNFSVHFINVVTSKLGHPARLRQFDIVLPVGISFFSFQAIGYLIDVWHVGGGTSRV